MTGICNECHVLPCAGEMVVCRYCHYKRYTRLAYFIKSNLHGATLVGHPLDMDDQNAVVVAAYWMGAQQERFDGMPRLKLKE